MALEDLGNKINSEEGEMIHYLLISVNLLTWKIEVLGYHIKIFLFYHVPLLK